jgi:5-methyltetrahydrofolate--homocysteine methyltransferase
MISPAMFRDLVLPSLTREAAFLGRVSYHLDGPGEVPHADMICSIPDVQIIQWTPGAGEPESWDEKWYPLYKRIIDHGKKILIFYTADEGLVRKLYSKFPAKEFCLTMHARSEKEARVFEALR